MEAIKGGEVRLAELRAENEQLKSTLERFVTEIGKMRAENVLLKVKVLRQRTELRRLNVRLRSMWEGARFVLGTDVRRNRRVSGTGIDGPRDLAAVDREEGRPM